MPGSAVQGNQQNGSKVDTPGTPQKIGQLSKQWTVDTVSRAGCLAQVHQIDVSAHTVLEQLAPDETELEVTHAVLAKCEAKYCDRMVLEDSATALDF